MHESHERLGATWTDMGDWKRPRYYKTAGCAGEKQCVEEEYRAVREGVGTLTLYAFSSDNWKRPPDEVEALMGLLGWYLEDETPRLIANGVRLSVIGRRDRLPPR